MTRAVLHAFGSPMPKRTYWIGNATLHLAIPTSQRVITTLEQAKDWLLTSLKIRRGEYWFGNDSATANDSSNICDVSQANADGICSEGGHTRDDASDRKLSLTFTLPLKHLLQIIRVVPPAMMKYILKFLQISV